MPLMDDVFYFTEHWRDTHLSIDLSDVMDGSGAFVGSVALFNQWGDRTVKHFVC